MLFHIGLPRSLLTGQWKHNAEEIRCRVTLTLRGVRLHDNGYLTL